MDIFFILMTVLVLASFIMIARNTFTTTEFKYIIRLNKINDGEKCKISIHNSTYICSSLEITLPYEVLRDENKILQLSNRILEFSVNTLSMVWLISSIIPINMSNVNTVKLHIEIEKRRSLNKRLTIDEKMISEIMKKGIVNYIKNILLICFPLKSTVDGSDSSSHISLLNIYLKTVDQRIMVRELKSKKYCELFDKISIPPVQILDEYPLEGKEKLIAMFPSGSCPSNSIKIGFTGSSIPYCLIWPYDFERHVAIIGPTGAGKTTLLAYIARSLLRSKLVNRLYIVDPKGDLKELLGFHPLIVYIEIDEIEALLEKINGQTSEPLNSVLLIDEAWRLFASASSQVLSMLRQARSRGLYIVYATQNPWDIPVSAANNTGTFIIFGSSNYAYIRGITELAGIHYEEARILYELRMGEYLVKTRDSNTHKVYLPFELASYLKEGKLKQG